MLSSDNITFLSALVAGILSFFSPCILPLLPAYIAYIGGSEVGKRSQLLLRLTFFIAGFTLVFVLLGATATWVGTFLLTYIESIQIGFAVLIIIFGLSLFDLLQFTPLSGTKRLSLPQLDNFLGSFFLGLALGFGWSPCVGPLLGSILVLAGMEDTVWQGMLMLLVYSLGLALPFVITALAADKVFSFVKKFGKGSVLLKRIAGLVLILFGIWLILSSLKIV